MNYFGHLELTFKPGFSWQLARLGAVQNQLIVRIFIRIMGMFIGIMLGVNQYYSRVNQQG